MIEIHTMASTCDSNERQRAERRAVHCFSTALAELKRGRAVCRAGWNGRGMYVSMILGSYASAPHERASHLNGIQSKLFVHGDTGTTRRFPHFELVTAEGARATWVPSITDLLAEDWEVL